MPLVTFRVDEETKRRMDQLEGVNWSQALREKVHEVIDRETRRNRIEALRSMERLSTKSPEGWDSTAFIRRVRDSRYGPRRR